VRTESDLRVALSGADFVINTVNVGGHGATVTDFEVPARHGVRQTIADTLGVGGVFRALRTFPVLDALADGIRAECPDAWLLNYTNPMAMNLQYLGVRHPQVKALGLCHSVYWTVHDLCELVGVPPEEVEFHSAGVNHQAWVLRWERDGDSLYPLLDERIAADADLRRRVRVDMYRRLGYYPTETSEHSSEYVAWYLHDDAEIERLRIPVGDYLRISAENVAGIDALVPLVTEGRYVEPEDEAAEYAPQVVHSLVTGERRSIQVTVPNARLIPDFAEGAGVEVPCLLDADGVRPQPVDPLPPGCVALNRQFLSVVDLTVRAAVEARPELVRRALMVDPNTSATLSLDAIWSLADDMVEAHHDLLPAALRKPVRL
jgi:alpha-galactosidase